MPSDICFFDLDRTITSVNLGTRWFFRELRSGHITVTQLAWILMQLLRHAWGARIGAPIGERAMRIMRGQTEAELRARVRSFVDDEVGCQVRPGALATIASLRERGATLVLLTSASSYLAEEYAARLGFEHVIATRFEVDAHGRLTGRPHGRICVGEAKRDAIVTFARERGTPLNACHFFTDSANDLPALETVGTPLVVHPDRRLRRIAARRGWQVLDWSGLSPRRASP